MSAERRDAKFFSRKFGIPVSEFLDFASYVNSNPPPDLTWVILDASSELLRIPENTCEDLREILSQLRGVEKKNVFLGSSFSEIVGLLITAENLKRVATEDSHESYFYDLLDFGCEITPLRSLSFEDISQLEAVDALIISNPSTANGKLRSREELLQIFEALLEREILLIVDERLIDLSDPSQSLSESAAELEGLVVLNSFERSFGLLGAPLSYAIASGRIADALEKLKPKGNVDVITRGIVRYLVENSSEYLKESRELIEREKRWMKYEMQALSIDFIESDANFFLIDPSSFGMSCEDFLEALARRGILLRYCGSYAGAGVRRREENLRLITSLKELVNRPENLSRKWFEELEKRDEVIGAKTSCPYYPCHFDSQDCTFCFCLFYPCGDERLGHYVKKGDEKVWSCMNCELVHKPEIAERLFRMMKEGRSKEEMWEWLLSCL